MKQSQEHLNTFLQNKPSSRGRSASGYLLKVAPVTSWSTRIRKGAADERIFTSDELRRITGLWQRHASRRRGSPFDHTRGKWLRKNGRGAERTSQIGEALHISYGTVKEHVQHTLARSAVSDRTPGSGVAVRNGLA